MLELKTIKKAYHSQVVLQDASLSLAKGIYWVKGNNGSGKTTLLKMIAGLLPFEGDILYNDISQKSKPIEYRKQVSWAEAEPLYPAFITGMDLIRFYQNIRKVPATEVEQLLALFDMSNYIKSPIGTYSAGMTKKLSLVLAFMGSPPLCILDEPLITLDAATVTLVSAYIQERHQQSGSMFILSSHQELEIQLTLTGKEITISNQRLSYSI